MAKLKPDPITLTDLEEYLVEYSDFSFEMSVLQALEQAHFSCDHSGSYTDPVSGKIRQFDIRAWRKRNGFG
jgi:hypothetical protein